MTPRNGNSLLHLRRKCATLGARPVGRATSFAKKSERCSTRRSPRVKTALLRCRRPTLAPDWIGFLAFRERFDLKLAAILAAALLPLGAAAGTNGKSRFCRPVQPAAVDRTLPISQQQRISLGGTRQALAPRSATGSRWPLFMIAAAVSVSTGFEVSFVPGSRDGAGRFTEPISRSGGLSPQRCPVCDRCQRQTATGASFAIDRC